MASGDERPEWAALPQPTRVRLDGGTWAPESVRVVLDLAGDGDHGGDGRQPGATIVEASVRRERDRLTGELEALGIRVQEPAEHDPEHDPEHDAEQGAERGAEGAGRTAASTVTLRWVEDVPDPTGSASAGPRSHRDWPYREDPERDETFAVQVDEDVTVIARTAEGLFRGTRQVLHNLRARGVVPRGAVWSRPAVSERGIHVDAARKFYPASWFLRLLPEIADAGVNTLQWHVSENEGFRLESLAFPQVMSDDHITREQARQIVRRAEDLHVRIVPSLDMPGHLRHVLERMPQHRLPQEGTDLDTDHALDVTSPDAVDMALRLVDDVAELFPNSRHWNLGGDEFVDFDRIDDYPALKEAARAAYGDAGTGFDLLTAFVNAVADHVASKGYTPRVWNDGMLRSGSVALDDRVELAWWTNWNASMVPLERALGTAHGIVNVNDAMFYYVLGDHSGYTFPTATRIWEADWHPGLFPQLPGGIRQEIERPYGDQLVGVSFAVWSDRPDVQTPEQVAAGIRRPLAAMAERAWNAGSALSLDAFLQTVDALLPTGAADPTGAAEESG